VADYADQENLLKENLTNKSQDISSDPTSEDAYPSNKAVAEYVASQSGVSYLLSAFRINQTGTSAPSDSNYYIDQVQISPGDNTNPLFRAFAFNRDDVGEYNMQILWLTGSASAIDLTKIDISCSDAKIRFGATSVGSFGPYSYYQQNFEVYTPAGVLSDSVLGATSIYVRLFN